MATIQTFVNNLGAGVLQTQWMSLSVMALGASVALLACIYLFAQFFRNQNLASFVKLELYEVFVTALMIAMLGTFIASLQSLNATTFFQGVAPDMGIYQATEQYFILAGQRLAGWMDANYAVNIWIDQMASITPYARPLGVGLVATPLAGLASPIKQFIYNVTIALGIAFIINQAQLYVFQFAVAGFLKYYLPIGIFLRSFTPTRRIGGTLIAIALVFLVLFPFMIMIDYAIVFGSESAITGFDVSLKSFLKQSYLGIGNDNQQEVRDSLEGFSFTGFIKDAMIGFSDFLGSVLKSITGGVVAALFMIPVSTVGVAFAMGYILPALNTLFMVEVGKYMSKTMGEEIDLSSLTRLI